MIGPSTIIDGVSAFRGIGRKELLGPRQDRAIAWPRHELVWAMRNLTDLSEAAIGRQIGDRDPTTIRNSLARIIGRRTESDEYRGETDRLLLYVQAHLNAAAGPETVLARARRIIVHPGSATPDDAAALALPLLTLGGMLATDQLTDSEARLCARTILNSEGTPHG